MSNHPELDKIQAAKHDSQIIGEFLDWARKRGWHFAEYAPEDAVDESTGWAFEGLLSVRGSIENWLAEYFEIDLARADQERNEILTKLRAGYEAEDAAKGDCK